MKRNQPEVVMICKSERKEPSEEAVDRFIYVYLEMVEENKKKLRGLKRGEENSCSKTFNPWRLSIALESLYSSQSEHGFKGKGKLYSFGHCKSQKKFRGKVSKCLLQKRWLVALLNKWNLVLG